MIGKNDNKLCIITAYRVCQTKGTTPNSPDSITAYWQQVQAMIKDGKVNPDPRAQVFTDLTKLISEKKSAGCEVIVMMDANEDWDELLEQNESLGREIEVPREQFLNIST